MHVNVWWRMGVNMVLYHLKVTERLYVGLRHLWYREPVSLKLIPTAHTVYICFAFVMAVPLSQQISVNKCANIHSFSHGLIHTRDVNRHFEGLLMWPEKKGFFFFFFLLLHVHVPQKHVHQNVILVWITSPFNLVKLVFMHWKYNFSFFRQWVSTD